MSSPAVNFIEMTTVTTGQDDQLTLRLANAWAPQVIWPRSYSASRGVVVASQARASARLPVLAGATWPRAWLLPCSGSGASTLPISSRKTSWWHPSIAGVFSGHAHPASPDLPSTSRVNLYRIKPHRMDTVHACTRPGYSFSRCGCGVVEPNLYYTRAEPKIDEGNRHISMPWPRPSQADPSQAKPSQSQDRSGCFCFTAKVLFLKKPKLS